VCPWLQAFFGAQLVDEMRKLIETYAEPADPILRTLAVEKPPTIIEIKDHVLNMFTPNALSVFRTYLDSSFAD
jgi:hypothetical protein